MGRKPEPTDDEQRLRALIREAHETWQNLNEAIKEARALAPGLVDQFEAVHKREMGLLVRFLEKQADELASQLNIDVDQAREEILRQLSISEMVTDTETGALRVRFTSGRFATSNKVTLTSRDAKEYVS